MAKPILTLHYLKGQFLLEQSDLKRVFDNIGEVWSIGIVDGGKKAIVILSSFEEVLKAFSILHGKEIVGHKTQDQLQLGFLEDSAEGRTLLEEAKKSNQKSVVLSEEQQPESKKTIDITFSNQKSNSQANQLPKLTCKYEIEPFDEGASKAFLLSKRIIGPKGSNMKKIIEECFADRPFEADALKLRLRGKGSGFKEGPQNKGITSFTLECNEPLHLCISAKNQFFYDISSKLIEQLLLDVCRSFDTYVSKNEFGDLLYEMYGPDSSACSVLKKESVNGHRPVLMYPESRDLTSMNSLGSKKNQKPKRTQGGQHRQAPNRGRGPQQSKPSGSTIY